MTLGMKRQATQFYKDTKEVKKQAFWNYIRSNILKFLGMGVIVFVVIRFFIF